MYVLVLGHSKLPFSCLHSLKVATWLGHGVRFREIGAKFSA